LQEKKKKKSPKFFSRKTCRFLQALEKRKGRQNRKQKNRKTSKIELLYYLKLYITLKLIIQSVRVMNSFS